MPHFVFGEQGKKNKLKMKKIIRLLLLFIAIVGMAINATAQSSTTNNNVISTGVPFISIGPDSRAGGMGDVGVATSADVNSQYWNPAKYVFMKSNMGVGLSYAAWLSYLVDDINLGYLSAYKKLDDTQALSASLRYFALGNIVFTNEAAETIGEQSPNEFAIDIAYSRLLSETLSGAVAIRYIRSDITGGKTIEGWNPGNTYAADIAFYYNNDFGTGNTLAAGINIQNIGAKISYDDNDTKNFIPTTLRLGASYTVKPNDYHSFSFAVEFDKLLVPTPSANQTKEDYQDISVMSGIFKSFSDAPGGFKEEMKEVMCAAGVEYWYNKQFALRTGYFHENKDKGNRQYFTAGAGLKLNVFSLDFSYLFSTKQNNPLDKTLRFSLAFDIDSFSKQQ